MSNFKVGDRVKYIKHILKADSIHFSIGKIYIVKYIASKDVYLNEDENCVFISQLEHYNPCEDILQNILDE